MSDHTIVVIWVIKTFLNSLPVYYYHFFLISSACVRSLQFLSFIVPILTWNIPLTYPVLLKKSLVIPILLFSSIYLHCPFKNTVLSLLTILQNSALGCVYLSLSHLPFASHLSSAIWRVSLDNHFAFLHFFLFGMVWSLLPVQYYKFPYIVLQTLCLPYLIPLICFLPPLYTHKGFS